MSEYAERSVETLTRYYDGIVKANVILSYERAHDSVKIAEVTIGVYNATLTSNAKSADFFKSIDAATAKVLVRLLKYKEKLHAKDRRKVRQILEKI